MWLGLLWYSMARTTEADDVLELEEGDTVKVTYDSTHSNRGETETFTATVVSVESEPVQGYDFGTVTIKRDGESLPRRRLDVVAGDVHLEGRRTTKNGAVWARLNIIHRHPTVEVVDDETEPMADGGDDTDETEQELVADGGSNLPDDVEPSDIDRGRSKPTRDELSNTRDPKPPVNYDDDDGGEGTRLNCTRCRWVGLAQNHPAVVMWSKCPECGDHGIEFTPADERDATGDGTDSFESAAEWADEDDEQELVPEHVAAEFPNVSRDTLERIERRHREADSLTGMFESEKVRAAERARREDADTDGETHTATVSTAKIRELAYEHTGDSNDVGVLEVKDARITGRNTLELDYTVNDDELHADDRVRVTYDPTDPDDMGTLVGRVDAVMPSWFRVMPAYPGANPVRVVRGGQVYTGTYGDRDVHGENAEVELLEDSEGSA